MTLIKSISGIRGTIGGTTKENLTPVDTVKFAAAYGTIIKENTKEPTIVIGRDGRMSGQMIQNLVVNTLVGLGINVLDCGLSTTPTIEMMVTHFNADGGIILTASHNPKQWNALKLLNEKGEFIDAAKGEKLLQIADSENFEFCEVDHLGKITTVDNAIELHIQKILELPYIEIEAIKQSNFKVVIDAINSTGAISIPPLLDKLGVDYEVINKEITGDFAHNPEPLAEHLTDLSKKVVEFGADFGICVDPDVDRLAFMSENGEMFGEEYTLVACADWVLSKKKGNTVSNMSSTRALRDIAQKHGVAYEASAVGEVNVVEKMKSTNAIIGGEGNGGIILGELHYGRDALVGIALFLSLLTSEKKKVSELKKTYPYYAMSKNKVQLQKGMNVDAILEKVITEYQEHQPNTIDGVKIDFENKWVHLRKSNTEPIIRIYTEAPDQKSADELANEWIEILKSYF